MCNVCDNSYIKKLMFVVKIVTFWHRWHSIASYYPYWQHADLFGLLTFFSYSLYHDFINVQFEPN